MLDMVENLDISVSGYLNNYVSWMRKERDIFAQGEGGLDDSEVQQWISMNAESRERLMDSLLENVAALGDPKGSNVARIYHRLARRRT